MSSQNNGVIDYQSLEKIMNSGLVNCVYKILREVNTNNQLIFKSGNRNFR